MESTPRPPNDADAPERQRQRRVTAECLVERQIGCVRLVEEGHDLEDRGLVHVHGAPIERLRSAVHVTLKERTPDLMRHRQHGGRLHTFCQHHEPSRPEPLDHGGQRPHVALQNVHLHDLHQRQQHVQRGTAVVVVQRQSVPLGHRALAGIHDRGRAVYRFQQFENDGARVEDLVQLPQQVLFGHVHEGRRPRRESVQSDGQQRVQRGIPAHERLGHIAHVGVRRLAARPVEQLVGHAGVAKVENRLARDEYVLRRSGRRHVDIGKAH
jgi:hypothetical protein